MNIRGSSGRPVLYWVDIFVLYFFFIWVRVCLINIYFLMGLMVCFRICSG